VRTKRRFTRLPADCLDRDVAADAEPVASIAAIADLVSAVTLRAVIEGDDVRRGYERRRVLVLDLDGRSREDEAIVLSRPGTVESGIGSVAAKGADPYQAGVVDHRVAEEGFLHAVSSIYRGHQIAKSHRVIAGIPVARADFERYATLLKEHGIRFYCKSETAGS